MTPLDMVRAALLEVGQPHLAAVIKTNRGGYLQFKSERLERCPTPQEVRLVHKAFVMTYRATKPEAVGWGECQIPPVENGRWWKMIKEGFDVKAT